MSRWVCCAVVLLVPGCFDPNYVQTECDARDECPSGFTCYTKSALCVPICKPPVDGWITMVETADASFSHGCIQGNWYLQAINGMTTPDAPGADGQRVAVAPNSLPGDTLDSPSRYAIHVMGSGQSQPGFAHLFMLLNAPPGRPMGMVDASAFTGVQFYAIVNAPSGANFAVGDPDTDSAFRSCSLTSGSPMGCGDRPRVLLTDHPVSAWTMYQPRFEQLMQLGTGNKTGTGPDFPKQAITLLEWEIALPSTGTVAPWELWIDDVKFY